MALTRTQLADEFLALEEELLRLEVIGAPEEAIQLVLEHLVNASTRSVGERDRLWWWGRLYSAMDQHAARLMTSSVEPVPQ